MHAIEDKEHLERSVKLNTEEIKYIQSELDRLGVTYVPSVCNFVMVETGRDCTEIFQELLKEGIIVRPLKGYRLPTSFRVSTGLHSENERFIRSLARVLGKA